MALPHQARCGVSRIAILSLGLACLGPALMAQQQTTKTPANSDGVTTTNTGTHGRSIVFSPALPPNSTELAYDSGDFSGVSRNLQNADIIPGWEYWAHSVRFTPVGNATGRLLEVRYVAAIQWGTTDFDVLIRDQNGLVLGLLPNQNATIDFGNWQVIDVSGLGIDVGSSEFQVELRPANPCGGDTGFTIAFSTPDNQHSSVSNDCSDTFLSYQSLDRDLFIRAVVENADGPTLGIANLIAGQAATLTGGNITPNQTALVAVSLLGGGPWLSPVGLANVTPPVSSISLAADAQGDASLSVAIPASLAGSSVWLQIFDPGTQTLGESIATQVQ